MGRLRIQLLFSDNTWSTRYNKAKKDSYSSLSTKRTLASLNFSIEKNGNTLVYDGINKTLPDICFSAFMISHSVYLLDQVKVFEDVFESIPGFRKKVSLMF